VCVVVCVCCSLCVCEWCDIRLLWYADSPAMVCVSLANVCVCVCAGPLPSDPHECVCEVHVLGVVSCV